MRLLRSIAVVDSHTEGHPTRVVLSGIPPLVGASVRARRDDFKKRLDHLRPMILHEPRGHAAMVGAITTESDHADIGAFFVSSYVYLDMCGHGLIGLARTLVATGACDLPPGGCTLTVETPAGIVLLELAEHRGDLAEVAFENVDSFLGEADLALEVEGFGHVTGDLAYGGCWYLIVDAAAHGLELAADRVQELQARGAAIKAALEARLRERPSTHGPEDGRINAVLFFADEADGGSRHVVVLDRNKFDRSPCGTGCSARLAALHARGLVREGETRLFRSVVGGCFSGRVLRAETAAGDARITARIAGNAHITAFSTLVVEAGDPLAGGFLCR